MSRQGNLVKNTAVLGIGTFLPRLATFITLPILTGILTKEEYGSYDLITVLVGLYLPAVTLQVQAASFRIVVQYRDNAEELKSTISSIFAFIIPLSIAGLLILWFFLPGAPLIKVLICAYFAADILVNNLRQMARGLGKNTDYTVSAGLSSVGSVLFVVIFVSWKRLGLTGAVLALVLSTLISDVILVYKLKISSYFRVRYINKDRIKETIAYSWPMVPNYMSMWVMRASDRMVVSAVMGVAANAVYAAANKIPSLLNMFQLAFVMAWQENATFASSDKDVSNYYSEMFETVLNMMSGFLGLLISATPILFAILIRGDYGDAYNQILVLYIAALLYCMSSFLGGIYVAYMKTKSVGVTTAIAAAINLVVDLLLIRKIGLYAASGSTLVSYLFLLIFRMVDVQKIVKIRFNYAKIGIIMAFLVVECVLCFQRTLVTDIINVLIAVIFAFVLNRVVIRQICEKLLKKVRSR